MHGLSRFLQHVAGSIYSQDPAISVPKPESDLQHYDLTLKYSSSRDLACPWTASSAPNPLPDLRSAPIWARSNTATVPCLRSASPVRVVVSGRCSERRTNRASSTVCHEDRHNCWLAWHDACRSPIDAAARASPFQRRFRVRKQVAHPTWLCGVSYSPCLPHNISIILEIWKLQMP